MPVETPGWDDVVCVGVDQVSNPLGDEVAVLDLGRGTYYGLNSTGARIWELLQKPIRVREIHAVLVDEFEVEEETARRDLLAVLFELRAAGLIEVRGGDGP